MVGYKWRGLHIVIVYYYQNYGMELYEKNEVLGLKRSLLSWKSGEDSEGSDRGYWKKRRAREVSEEVMTKSTVISIVSLKVYVFS